MRLVKKGDPKQKRSRGIPRKMVTGSPRDDSGREPKKQSVQNGEGREESRMDVSYEKLKTIELLRCRNIMRDFQSC